MVLYDSCDPQFILVNFGAVKLHLLIGGFRSPNAASYMSPPGLFVTTVIPYIFYVMTGI